MSTTTKAQHTPGPWTVVGTCGIRSATGVHVGGVGSFRRNDPATGERAANVRLIASAPEMLAALVEVLAIATEHDWPEEHVTPIRAAIAKARGEG